MSTNDDSAPAVPAASVAEKIARLKTSATAAQAARDATLSFQQLLPFVYDDSRIAPNALLRSAIFAAVNTVDRIEIRDAEIPGLGGKTVFYSGRQLNQEDLDVWMSLFLALKNQYSIETSEQTCAIKITAYQLLKLQGLSDSGQNNRALAERLTSLRSATVRIVNPKAAADEPALKITGLITEATQLADKTWHIAMSPSVARLFGENEWSYVSWNVRRELAKKPLAKWIHAFYETHRKPIPLPPKKLLEYSRSGTKNPSAALQNLKRAFRAVEQACAKHGEKIAFTIHNDLVYVSRDGRPPQLPAPASRRGRQPGQDPTGLGETLPLLT